MTLLPLSPPTVAPFGAMTFPRYQQHLASVGTEEFLAIGALEGDKPVGMVLAETALAARQATVLSLFVAPEQRRSGIATALLAALDAQLRRAGCERCDIVYARPGSADLPIDRLLDQNGWSPPVPRMTLCKAGNAILSARFLRRRPLGPDVEIFPWRERTVEDEFAIRDEQSARPWFPEPVSPFQEPDIQEPMNSLGVRHLGRVAGWMITHRVAPDTVRYTSLFVRAELRGRGLSMALVHDAACLQRAALGPDSLAMFGVLAGNNEMRRFVDRVMAPYLVSRIDTLGRVKRLA